MSHSSSTNTLRYNEDPENPYTFFMIDTETSGCEGIPIYHPMNQLIEVYSEDLISNNIFHHFCLPYPEFPLAQQSSKLHHIPLSKLHEEGVEPNSLMQGLIQFTQEHTKPNTQVLKIAHSADFDQCMVYKLLPFSIFGKQCKTLNWEWFDTCAALKHYYPEIEKNKYKPEFKAPPILGRPYRLDALMLHFYPNFSKSGFHSAEFDATALKLLFINQILPLEKENIYKKRSKFFLSYTPLHGPLQIKILTPLHSIKWFKIWTTSKICKQCNDDFKKAGGTYIKFLTSPPLFTPFHLFVWGTLQCKLTIHNYTQSVANSKKIPQLPSSSHEPLPPDSLFPIDPWWNSLRHIEIFLRKTINIFSDEALVTLFRYLTNSLLSDIYSNVARFPDNIICPPNPSKPTSTSTPLNLTYNETLGELVPPLPPRPFAILPSIYKKPEIFVKETIKQKRTRLDPSKYLRMFPTCAGEPVAYLPFKFSSQTAKLFQKLGMNSSNDIYITSLLMPDNETRIRWCNSINTALPTYTEKESFNPSECMKVFNEMKKSFIFNDEERARQDEKYKWCETL